MVTSVANPASVADSAADDRGQPEVVDLGKNENPFPSSVVFQPAVLQAIADLHRYPNDGDLRQLGESIAQHYGVDRNRVLICRGVDEAMDLVIGEFRGSKFTVVSPGFDGFVDRLKVFRRSHRVLDLGKHFELKVRSLGCLGEDSFTVLSNPNNPTGQLFPQSRIEEIVASSGMTLVDEAYVEFASGRSLVRRAGGRLLVYRSLSKAYGLAGLRAGFLFGEPTLIRRLVQAQRYFGVDLLAVAVMRCALSDYPVHEISRRVVELRQDLLGELRRLGLRAYDSEANFILVRDDFLQPMVAGLEALGILVRDTASMGLPGHVRISVGSAESNRRLLEALSRLS